MRADRGAASLFRAFPEATAYRVIERDIDTASRRAIEARLPFQAHYNDFGKHSLYVALRSRRPVGMVLIRNETSAFGLTTVEWTLKFDLSIAAFRFQSGRHPHKAKLQGSEFVHSLYGKSPRELQLLLNEHGQLKAPPPNMPEDALDLASVVVRSAVKSQAVLDVVWGNDVRSLHGFAIGLDSFPRMLSHRILHPKPSRDHSSLGPKASGSPTVDGPSEDGETSTHVSFAVRCYGRSDAAVGTVAELILVDGIHNYLTRWSLDKAHRVQRIEPLVPLPRHLTGVLRTQIGADLATIATSKNPLVAAPARTLHSLLQPEASSR
ncbi:MAG: hypothetical protein AB8H80_08790 [Planctomycetota bacterium]